MDSPVLAPGRRTIGPPAPSPSRRPIGPPAGFGGATGALATAPVAALSRRREFVPNATLVSRFDLTPAIARFVVRPDAGVPAFKPGQYFALGFEVEGELLQRPYSTASPAGSNDALEFLVRRVATGTFTPHLWQLGPGGRVWIGPPKGLFTLRPGDERTHLFVSTGTGLAPFISMSEALLATSPASVMVVHGVSYVAELAYRDRLEAWSASGRLRYVPTVSRPDDPANAGWTGDTGRTEQILDRVFDRLALDRAATVAYICGNPDMVEAATKILLDLGLSDAAVIRELYWTS